MNRPNKYWELIRTFFPTMYWWWWHEWREWDKTRNTTSPNCTCPVGYYTKECPEHKDMFEFLRSMVPGGLK
jgi:hypothetical protein